MNALSSHHTIASADLAIAATTIRTGTRLLTCNFRHFPMFADLRHRSTHSRLGRLVVDLERLSNNVSRSGIHVFGRSVRGGRLAVIIQEHVA